MYVMYELSIVGFPWLVMNTYKAISSVGYYTIRETVIAQYEECSNSLIINRIALTIHNTNNTWQRHYLCSISVLKETAKI